MQQLTTTRKLLIRTVLCLLALAAALTAKAQSYSNAVMSLNPIAYWPLNETTPPPAPFSVGLTATNSGSLGAQGNGLYGAWYQPSGNTWFLTNNILQTNGIGGPSDKAMWCKEQNGQYVVVPRTTGGVYRSNLVLVPPFSIEAWVIPNATSSGTYGIFAEGGSTQNYGGPNTNNPYYGGGGTGYAGVVMGQYNTFFLFDCFATNGTSKGNELDSPTSGANAPKIGQWNHLVCTFDGTTERMYINNNLAASKTVSKNNAGVTFAPDLNTPIMIGSGPEVSAQSGEGGITMNGVIDEVAVYNQALSTTSIANHFAAASNSTYSSAVMADNPILYYQFNDGLTATNGGYPSSTFPVATNYGSLGTNANGVYQPGTTPGAAGPGYVGMGSGSSVAINGCFGAVDVGGGNLPSALNPVGKVPFSVVTWFQGNSADAPARYQDILGHGNNSYRMAMGQNCGEVRFNPGPANTELQFFNPTDMITNHALFNDGNWHMLSGVTDGTNAYMYVDGVLYKSTNSVTGINITGSSIDVMLGGAPDSTTASYNSANTIRYFDGQIAQVAMWSNALSAAQIQSMYNAAGVPPSFIVQPLGLTNNQGTTTNMATIVSGSQTITYQWYQNGTILNGQTNATITFSPITTNNAGNYYLVASNYAGTATSAVVNVTVFGPPSVVQQTPAQLNIFAGSSPTLNITAIGAQPITYQWSSNSITIPGATNSSYIVVNVQTSATYSCMLSNYVNTTVATPIAITALADPTAPFPAEVLSDGPVAYYRLDEQSGNTAYDYVGGNNATYNQVTLGVPGYDSGHSTQTDPSETACEFGDYPPNNDYAGNVPSYLNFGASAGNNVELTVEAWVQQFFYTGGGDAIVALGYGNGGEQFVLDTGNGANGSLRFFGHTASGGSWGASSTNLIENDGHWHHVVGVCDEAGGKVALYLDGAQIASGTVATNSGFLGSTIPLSIGARESANNIPASYDFQFLGQIDDVAVYNKALNAAAVQAHYFSSGVSPSSAQITPSSLTTNQGANVTLTVTAQGTTPFTYQWIDENGSPIPGATNATVILSNVQPSQSGTYSVQVMNAFGTVTPTMNLNVVLGPPQITADISPLNQNVFEGDPITFTVTASGSLPFSYQWYQDGAKVNGATNSTYSFASLAGTNTYYVTVTNAYTASQAGGVPAQSSTATVIGEQASFVNSSNFTTYMKITFAGYTRSETLRDFPVLVKLSTNISGFAYSQFASPTGGDLRFAEANTGRELPYEIDQWQDSNGISSVWVQVPQITGTNSYVWAFWGNSSNTVAPAYTTNGAVWVPQSFEALPGFDIVYHLKESGFPYLDSTLDDTSTNGVAPIQDGGIVGNGELFDGLTTYLDAGTVTNLDDNFTLSAWVNIPPGTSSCQTVWANQKGGFGSAGFSFFVNYYQSTNGALLMDTGNGVNGGEVSTAASAVSFGAWHQVDAAVNRTNAAITLYIDGQYAPIVSGNVTANFTNVGDLNLGRFTNSALYFTGSMDEARIHQGIDSSNWIWASYMTVASNTVFSAYSSVTSSAPEQVLITIVRQGNQVVLTWPAGNLYSSPLVQGPYTLVSGATSPYTNTASATQMFYRVH